MGKGLVSDLAYKVIKRINTKCLEKYSILT